MVVLAILRIPIFVSLGLVGIVGLILTSGFNTAMGIVASLPFAVLANYGIAVIPLFFLMGQVAGEAGIVKDAYEAIYKLTGHLRGGLAMATTVGSAFSSATMGSSVANAALFTRVALPEMLKFNYDKSFSLGCIFSRDVCGHDPSEHPFRHLWRHNGRVYRETPDRRHIPGHSNGDRVFDLYLDEM
jgi:TRAP-type mannitol/chloroaromatic compound transport system permease large subunit